MQAATVTTSAATLTTAVATALAATVAFTSFTTACPGWLASLNIGRIDHQRTDSKREGGAEHHAAGKQSDHEVTPMAGLSRQIDVVGPGRGCPQQGRRRGVGRSRGMPEVGCVCVG